MVEIIEDTRNGEGGYRSVQITAPYHRKLKEIAETQGHTILWLVETWIDKAWSEYQAQQKEQQGREQA